MKKSEIRAICEKYGFETVLNELTGAPKCLQLLTADDIEELDEICFPNYDPNVAVEKEYGAYQAVYGKHLYTVYVNSNWLNFSGWI